MTSPDAEPDMPEGNLAQFYVEHPDLGHEDLPDSLRQVGERIEKARRQAGLEVEELGGQLGVSAETIRQWEAGEAAAPSKLLNRAAGVLGVSLSWLLIAEGVEPSTEGPDVAELQADLHEARRALRAVESEIERVANRLASGS